MAGINKAILIGRLGHDPSMRHTQDGKAVANFSFAVSEKYGGEEKTQWFKVVAFNRLAEICGEYLTKGSQIYVEGKIQSSEWETKDGDKRFDIEIRASTIQMLGGKGESKPKAEPKPDRQTQAPDYDDDIPF